MPIDLDELRRKLAEETPMDDLPSCVRMLCPVDLDPVEIEEIATRARAEGGSSDVIVGELVARGHLEPNRLPIGGEVSFAEDVSIETDPLTGLGNWQSFQQAISSAVSRNLRSQSPLSILIADLNGFKKVNDVYGYQVGDEVLRTTGRVLRESAARYEGSASRLHGDEFAIVLSLGVMESIDWAERLQEKIAVDLADHSLTISLGLVTFKGSFPDVSEMLREADEALDFVKHVSLGKPSPWETIRTPLIERHAVLAS